MISVFNARHSVLRRWPSSFGLLIITGFQLLIINHNWLPITFYYLITFYYHNWFAITSYKAQPACVYLLLIMTGLQLANFRWVEPSSTCSFSAHCCFANHFRSLASIFNFDLKSTMSAGLGVWCFQFLMKYFCPIKAILRWFSFLLGCAICLFVTCNLFAMNTGDF